MKFLLTDPSKLKKGLETYRAEQEVRSFPYRERLEVINNLLAENSNQLDRVLDLYLSGDFPKEALVERKERIRTTITALEKEKSILEANLRTQTLTDGEIQSLQLLAVEVIEALDMPDIEKDFETQLSIIEAFDVRATLMEEEGKKVIYVECKIGEAKIPCELSPTEL